MSVKSSGPCRRQPLLLLLLRELLQLVQWRGAEPLSLVPRRNRSEHFRVASNSMYEGLKCVYNPVSGLTTP
jgi:hypothetical protein